MTPVHHLAETARSSQNNPKIRISMVEPRGIEPLTSAVRLSRYLQFSANNRDLLQKMADLRRVERRDCSPKIIPTRCRRQA